MKKIDAVRELLTPGFWELGTVTIDGNHIVLRADGGIERIIQAVDIQNETYKEKFRAFCDEIRIEVLSS